jgi:hypothetical protein
VCISKDSSTPARAWCTHSFASPSCIKIRAKFMCMYVLLSPAESWCVCMYMFIYVCDRRCMYVYVYLCMHMWVCMLVCMCLTANVWMYACMYVRSVHTDRLLVYLCISPRMYVGAAYMYVYVYVCVWQLKCVCVCASMFVTSYANVIHVFICVCMYVTSNA